MTRCVNESRCRKHDDGRSGCIKPAGHGSRCKIRDLSDPESWSRRVPKAGAAEVEPPEPEFDEDSCPAERRANPPQHIDQAAQEAAARGQELLAAAAEAATGLGLLSVELPEGRLLVAPGGGRAIVLTPSGGRRRAFLALAPFAGVVGGDELGPEQIEALAAALRLCGCAELLADTGERIFAANGRLAGIDAAGRLRRVRVELAEAE